MRWSEIETLPPTHILSFGTFGERQINLQKSECGDNCYEIVVYIYGVVILRGNLLLPTLDGAKIFCARLADILES